MSGNVGGVRKWLTLPCSLGQGVRENLLQKMFPGAGSGRGKILGADLSLGRWVSRRSIIRTTLRTFVFYKEMKTLEFSMFLRF